MACALIDEIVEEAILLLSSFDDVHHQGIQMFLGLLSDPVVAVVVGREDELNDRGDEVILGVVFIFDRNQVMERMIEEDVSLQDFMAFDVASISLQTADSIVVDGLAGHLDCLVVIGAMSANLIEQHSLDQAREGELRCLLESLWVVSIWSVAIVKSVLKLVIIAHKTGKTEPVNDFTTSSQINLLQEGFVEVPVSKLFWDWNGWIENNGVQYCSDRVFKDLDSFVVIEQLVYLHGFGQLTEGHHSSV